MKEYVRAGDLAKSLGITKSYAYLLMQMGTVPYVEVGGYKLIEKKVADELMAKWQIDPEKRDFMDQRFKLNRKPTLRGGK